MILMKSHGAELAFPFLFSFFCFILSSTATTTTDPSKVLSFTTNTTWIVPNGVKGFKIVIWGAGGGTDRATGGGSGALCCIRFVEVAAGTTCHFTVGAGGDFYAGETTRAACSNYFRISAEGGKPGGSWSGAGGSNTTGPCTLSIPGYTGLRDGVSGVDLGLFDGFRLGAGAPASGRGQNGGVYLELVEEKEGEEWNNKVLGMTLVGIVGGAVLVLVLQLVIQCILMKKIGTRNGKLIIDSSSLLG
eukprot:TRINITY_DN4697_c0_g1_i1.p1 TRINITY_DN4697_c0_g1~~TRINITY_DN4697_c0_g1_i1.p1  ORF type:complete len:246 (+),score=51.19 TRINITY_DN4697_c0_g1_i1:95-832(+)